MGGGGEIMAGHGWSWVVVVCREWSWMVARFSNDHFQV